LITVILNCQKFCSYGIIITVIINFFLHGLGLLTCSGIDTVPSFPGAMD
jgi:hypothetical protein